MHAEEQQNKPTHRVGGVAAVLQQVFPGLVALLHGVAAERAEERAEGIKRERELADHRAARALCEMRCGPARGGGFEAALPLRERKPWVDARHRLVGEVICDPHRCVDRCERKPQRARQQEGPDREILVVGARQLGAGAQVLLERRAQRSSGPGAPRSPLMEEARARSRRYKPSAESVK